MVSFNKIKHTNMQYQNQKQPKKRLPNRLLIVAAVVVILVAGGLAWHFRQHRVAQSAPSSLSRSTQLEQQIGQQQANQKAIVTNAPSSSDNNGSTVKDAPAASSSAPVASPATPIVTPVINYPTNGSSEKISAVEVDGYIPTITENGGTCTLTLTGPRTISKTTTSSYDGQTTRCQNLYITSADGITTGSWNAVLSYKSAAYQGSSTSVTFTVY
jgi:cytoskeletal protein RodZ